MSHAARTLILAGSLVALLAVDAFVHREMAPDLADLPALARVDPLVVGRLRITRGDEQIVIDRSAPETWTLTAPLQGTADRMLVSDALKPLREPVPMDVRVDRGNLDQYGLDGADGIRVQIEDQAGAMLTDFYVGNNASGGTSFLRLPDGDDVFRARIGGRHRYDRPAAEWRNHMLLDVDPAAIESLVVTESADALSFARESRIDSEGRPVAGPWLLQDDASFRLDQRSADELVSSLATLRAGEILAPDHPAGLDTPAATVKIGVNDGETWDLAFGRTADGAFARVGDQPDVYRVAGSLLERLTAPRSLWRDRQLLRFERAQIHQMVLVEAGLRSVLEQDPANSSWRMVEPANVASDLRQAMYDARLLAELRADALADVSPGEAGFPSTTRIEVDLLDGTKQSLEIGAAVPNPQPGREAFYVRTPDQPERVGTLAMTTLSQLRKAWAR